MKRIEDIKEFKDIDTYYEISEIVEEVFQDRVEAHKHLITANKEIERLNNIINELENRDDVLEEFEDWLEKQKTRNSEWDNFIMVDGRLGIPISYLLNKLQELKGSDKE